MNVLQVVGVTRKVIERRNPFTFRKNITDIGGINTSDTQHPSEGLVLLAA